MQSDCRYDRNTELLPWLHSVHVPAMVIQYTQCTCRPGYSHGLFVELAADVLTHGLESGDAGPNHVYLVILGGDHQLKDEMTRL